MISIAQFESNMAGVGTSDICLLPGPVLTTPRCSCCFQPFDEWDDLRCRDCGGEELFISRTVINCRDPMLGALYVWGSQEIYLHIYISQSWNKDPGLPGILAAGNRWNWSERLPVQIFNTYLGNILGMCSGGSRPGDVVSRCQHFGGRFIGISGLCYQQ